METPHIQIMDEALASQVAAGEVVERPASVIKELVENSLDAGADTISVDIRQGGVGLIRISDNGCGMTPENARLCFCRHATSKMKCLDDLFAISHLGFRGEALPSIASVAKVNLTTRPHDALEGTQVQVMGGSTPLIKSSGGSFGTTIEVAELFFNTPARRKFLKSNTTEAAHIEHQLRLHALAFPRVRFIFRREGKLIFDLPATADHRVRILELSHADMAHKLLRMPPTEQDGISLGGYLLPHTETRRTGKNQFIFLNNRPIDDPLISRAIRDAYGATQQELYPSIFLYLQVEPALVDVNVHPAKREVRFRRPSDVQSLIFASITQALTHAIAPAPAPVPASQPKPTLQPLPPMQTTLPLRQRDTAPPASSIPPAPTSASDSAPLTTPTSQFTAVEAHPSHRSTTQPPASHTSASRDFRPIGILLQRYALLESPQGLVIFDPRAGTERIIFEELTLPHQQATKANAVLMLPSQHLLSPIVLELDPRDFTALLNLHPHLEKVGFIISNFGKNTLKIEALPALLRVQDAHRFLLELIDDLTHAESLRGGRNPAFDAFALQLALRAAKAAPIDLANPIPLLDKLLLCEVPYCTPQGKPTLIAYAPSEINRRFGHKS